MAITASQVKELREKTGAGMMECKKALSESNGDLDKAVKYLKEKGIMDAGKRSAKATGEGIIFSLLSDDKRSGIILEANCETDFVARTDDFLKGIEGIAKDIMARDEVETADKLPADLEEKLKELIAKMGENIKINRFKKYKASENQILTDYIHQGSKIGTITMFDVSPATIVDENNFSELTKDVCMHITAASPVSVSKDDMPEEVITENKEIFTKQAKDSGKPDNIIEKMVMGRLNKFFKEACLIDQPFVKDSELSVKEHITKVAKDLGGNVEVKAFTRYRLGDE